MTQLTLLKHNQEFFMDLREASKWASQYLNRKVTTSNISYLIQYGRISKIGENGNLLVDMNELKNYYDIQNKEKEKKILSKRALNWHLSFIEYTEAERTKHVHRLHPYKGKFIPQLVEYFLDSHSDEFKKEAYFKKGEIVLDPFCGSGTTLVQCNELGLHAIGIDISPFNTLISNVKIEKHSFAKISESINNITQNLLKFCDSNNYKEFDECLLEELSKFNSTNFPSPEYKRKVNQGVIEEYEYSKKKELEFLKTYQLLVEKYRIKILQDKNINFLEKWLLYPVRNEVDFIFNEIKKIDDADVKKVLAIILSRTVRSCRATTHADLATLKEPVTTTYYCKKHGKICKPIFSIMKWWETYTQDTLNRLKIFDKLRTDTIQFCIIGDSRNINIFEETKKRNASFYNNLISQKISGIFSSPPYVGLIDYHEQHAYAYEIFGFDRYDNFEIGPLKKGQGKDARESYINDISKVLKNCKKYLVQDYNIFLVANDKFNLYPRIAELCNMRIVNRFERPVLCRVEKDRSSYAETIFHLKENQNE
ncbi:MAG TPA: DNA methyltransferase [Candidatus Sumerlaeota bacterium]|nr:MAG: DNA methylase [candidate division BRC1 bacterium ADurb.Bin183]HOE63013.1 DNA methyltransferase [Candidatus Sumerlaeota bacterium]HRR30702.1 DNA methyltransferase [Candidatus Sumerlaeia bacterium]HON49559.1 DNA methyltransferase [Candidatus Sumerlaeota bacterium]HOR64710.1 DNA methyltransferase [Candidatus Sumerlaeota bacterium]